MSLAESGGDNNLSLTPVGSPTADGATAFRNPRWQVLVLGETLVRGDSCDILSSKAIDTMTPMCGQANQSLILGFFLGGHLLGSCIGTCQKSSEEHGNIFKQG